MWIEKEKQSEIFNSFELLYDPSTHSLDRTFLEKKQELCEFRTPLFTGFSSFTNKGKLRLSIWFSKLSYEDSVARRFTLVFLFTNSKCKRYFHNKLKPSKLTWTAMYRKQHKKDLAQEAVTKRHRATKKPYSRPIVGATLEVIQKKRSEKPEVRDAAREAALRAGTLQPFMLVPKRKGFKLSKYVNI
ncbi:putative ribosomal protein L24e/L24 superfamily [Helianthus annuus]|nr:putative ribosomal protein L24e/L24 superfamily [Helianthus annuus]